MQDRAEDWIAAARCHAGPRIEATFADLPDAHQDEMVRFGLLAAASSAFFIALGMMLTPLPSRSLTSFAALPHPVPMRAPLLETRLASTTETIPAAPARPRSVRLRPSFELAALQAPIATRPTAAPAREERRRNVFSRFFRSLVRRNNNPQPVSIKADATS
jgi:hypothetical protein